MLKAGNFFVMKIFHVTPSKLCFFSFLKYAPGRKAFLEEGISHVTLIIYLKRVPLCLKKGDGFIIPDSAIEVSLWIIQNLHGIWKSFSK